MYYELSISASETTKYPGVVVSNNNIYEKNQMDITSSFTHADSTASSSYNMYGYLIFDIASYRTSFILPIENEAKFIVAPNSFFGSSSGTCSTKLQLQLAL